MTDVQIGSVVRHRGRPWVVIHVARRVVKVTRAVEGERGIYLGLVIDTISRRDVVVEPDTHPDH